MSIVRTLYLYLFSLIGLVLVVIGAVGLLNIALKAFIFTQAEKDLYGFPSCAPVSIEKLSSSIQPAATTTTSSQSCLTEQEKADINQWIVSYKIWQEQNQNMNYATVQRQRDAAQNLAIIFIGLPLYLFHWATIKRELKNEKEGKA